MMFLGDQLHRIMEHLQNKSSKFLDNFLKGVMQNVWSYMKDSHDFLKKIKHLKIFPNNALFLTANVVELYPSIPHEAGLRALKEVLYGREEIKISTGDLVLSKWLSLCLR